MMCGQSSGAFTPLAGRDLAQQGGLPVGPGERVVVVQVLGHF